MPGLVEPPTAFETQVLVVKIQNSSTGRGGALDDFRRANGDEMIIMRVSKQPSGEMPAQMHSSKKEDRRRISSTPIKTSYPVGASSGFPVFSVPQVGQHI